MLTDLGETKMSFNFDEWVELAKNNPERFEDKRQHLIEEFISSCPEKHKKGLGQLQWQIDGIRLRAPSPMVAAGQMHRLMQQRLSRQKELFEELKKMLPKEEKK